MVFPIAGGNESKGYEVENSLRFDDSSDPRLTRTNSSTGDRQKFTFSAWVKLSTLDSSMCLFSTGTSSSDTGAFRILHVSANNIQIRSGATVFRTTSAVFRDTAAWYHIVVAVDTTQGTADNRLKLYVNGSQITNFSANNTVSENLNTPVNESGKTHTIGMRSDNSNDHFDGYMTEINLIDGQQLAQTQFGEFDNNGVWIPKKYTGTYGTNGFFMEFQQTGTSQNSSGIGADTSGNDNHFAVTNIAVTDITEDTCTNNFVTLNPITPVVTHTLSEGNCKSANSSGTHGGTTATINLPTSGKWYWEVKIEAESSDKGQGVGIGNQIYRSASDWGNYPNMIIYLSDGTKQNESGYASYGNAHNADDIIGVAYNADDQELTFYHNNSSQGTIPTSEMDGEIDFDNVSIIVFGRNVTQSFNFGNPPYTISSGNTDGKYGNFEYAPPSGYYALCTKRLAEFG